MVYTNPMPNFTLVKVLSHGYRGEDQNGRNIFFGGPIAPVIAPAILTNAYNRFDLTVAV
jgi:hypothetical protein